MTTVEAICRTSCICLLRLLRQETDVTRQSDAAQACVDTLCEMLGLVSRDEHRPGREYVGDDDICQLMSDSGIRLTGADWDVVHSFLLKIATLAGAIIQGTVAETLDLAEARAEAFVASLGDPQ